jgi:hypothetical protein
MRGRGCRTRVAAKVLRRCTSRCVKIHTYQLCRILSSTLQYRSIKTPSSHHTHTWPRTAPHSTVELAPLALSIRSLCSQQARVCAAIVGVDMVLARLK